MDESVSQRSRFQILENLFARAQQIPAEERGEAIGAWCHGDTGLLEDLRALLLSDLQVETKIATAGTSKANTSHSDGGTSWHDSWIGRPLGPFLIERLLGEGGMGAVFYARRVGDELRQEVAVKVIARRVHSSAAMRMLYAERDAMAKMRHPNIARLLGASFTTEGQPYVVMEYIRGVPLHTACDDPAVSATTKLSWMNELCAAVDSMHSMLLLHRDLKPSNVLVTPEGVVKLLDFGTSKLLAPEHGDSAMTQAGVRAMTPRYASPEQLAGANLTTASDLYSLGLILYRMLSGETLEMADRDFPVPPSQTRARAHRPPFSSSRRLCRDLDAIVLKATQALPEKRYGSALKMAEDIQAAEALRPVAAAREGKLNRNIRFLRRHWKPVVSINVVLLAMAMGILAVSHQSKLERESVTRNQHGLAQEQALAHMLLFDFFEQLKSIPGSTDIQRRTVAEATQYLDHVQSAQHNQDAPGLREDAVDAYTKLGNLLGNPYEENLGDMPGAVTTLKKAVSLAQVLADRDPANVATAEALATAEQSLGRLYFASGKPKDALGPLQAAASTTSRIANSSGATSAQMAQAASASDVLGDLYDLPGAANLNNLAQALSAYETALQFHQKGFQKDASCIRCQRGVAVESWKLGLVTQDNDRVFAMASLHRGLDAISRMAPAEQASTRTRRIDNVLRNTLGSLQLHTGDARGSLATLLPVHARFSESIRLDPIDDRARFDRNVLDLDLGEAHGVLWEWADSADSYSEAAADADFLMEKDRNNPQWQTVRARALLGLGNAHAHLHETRGVAELQEGLRLAIASAERNDSDADALSLAADSILAHPQLVPNAGPLALRFAEQSIRMSGQPTRQQQNTLNKAEALARKH